MLREKQKHDFDKIGTFCPIFIRLLAWKDGLCFLFSSKMISKFGRTRGLETEHLFYEASLQMHSEYILNLNFKIYFWLQRQIEIRIS